MIALRHDCVNNFIVQFQVVFFSLSFLSSSAKAFADGSSYSSMTSTCPMHQMVKIEFEEGNAYLSTL